MLRNAFRIEASTTTLATLYQFRRIILPDLYSVLTVNFFDSLLFEVVVVIFERSPVFILIFLFVLFLSGRLPHVSFGSLDFLILIIVLSPARFGGVVIGVVLFHLLVDVLVGVGLVARGLALLIVVVIVILRRGIYM
jgi:hypothetical protein